MEYDYNNQEYLQHYGVPGMKWGIRRNSRLLANHNRNEKVRTAKLDYKTGKINKKEKKTIISDANKAKKAEIKSGKREIRQTHGYKNIKELKKNLKNMTISEVPHSKVKKGANIVNKMFHASYAASYIGAGTALTLTGGIGAIPLGVGALGAAASVGEGYLIQRGILDKLS